MRVLVVEDEPGLAASIRDGLELEGFTVDVAPDGLSGLWHARENSYDILLLDIMLPGMNGFKLCATIRAEGIWTPILMLTAKDGELDEADALDIGADDYLTKPFAHVVLMARIRALLRRGAPARPSILSVAGLTLNPSERTVRHGDTVIDVTPREYALLELFMRRAGQVVTKTEILDNIWGDDFLGDVNIVEVYVGYLRKKLGDLAPALQTVRGHGYVMNEPVEAT